VFSVLPAMLEVGWFEAQGVASQDTTLTRFDEAGIASLELELEPEANPEEVWKKVRSRWTLERWGAGTLTDAAFVEDMFAQVRAHGGAGPPVGVDGYPGAGPCTASASVSPGKHPGGAERGYQQADLCPRARGGGRLRHFRPGPGGSSQAGELGGERESRTGR